MRQEALVELERIRSEDPDGKLHPEAVVAGARPAASPLHRHFTWGNDEAARRWRLHQAGKMIRMAITVLPSDNTIPVRMFVSVGSDRTASSPVGSGGGYRSVVNVMSSEELLAELLDDALREINNFRRKYRRLTALAPVISAMDDAMELLGDGDDEDDEDDED